MTDPLVPVMRRDAFGYPEHVNVDGGRCTCTNPKCTGPRGDYDKVAYVPLSAALTSDITFDAFLCAYATPEIPRRLAGSGALALAPKMQLFIVDVEPSGVDGSGHGEVTAEWWAKEQEKIEAAFYTNPGYAYRTRGGYRLVWLLAEPYSLLTPKDARRWSLSYLTWLDDLERAFEIKADRKCNDWTRIFRLPRVVRDGTPQAPEWTEGNPAEIGTWHGILVDESAVPEIAPSDYIIPTWEGALPEAKLDEAADILASAWPKAGRHQACMALSGALARAGWPAENIAEFVTGVMGRSGKWSVDPVAPAWRQEYDKQVGIAQRSIHRTQTGETVSGWPSLEKLLVMGVDAANAQRVVNVVSRTMNALGMGMAEGEDFIDAIDAASKPRAKTHAEMTWDELLDEAAGEIIKRLGLKGEQTKRPSPLFENVAELMSKTFSETPWLVHGLITKGGVAVVATEPKSAKTWAATEVAMAIATGTPAFGHYPVDQAYTTAYFYAEDMDQSVQTRWRALATGRGMTGEEAGKNAWVQPRGQFIDILKLHDVARIVASCWRLGPIGLLVLDPLRDIHSAEEDKSDQMKPVMQHLRLLSEILGCTTLFVHHSAKSSDSNKGRRPGQKMRGSSAVHGSVDCGIYLEDLSGNGEDEFTNVVKSEVKGVRSAGKFELTLNLVDNTKGEAQKATWRVSKLATTSKNDRLDEKMIEILSTLLTSTQPSLGENKIQAKVKGKQTDVSAACRRGASLGYVEQVRQGNKPAGWKLTPAGRSFLLEGTQQESDPEEPVDIRQFGRLITGQTPASGDIASSVPE